MGGSALVVFFANVPDKFRFNNGFSIDGRRFMTAVFDFARHTTTLPDSENILLVGKDDLSSW
jgi:hypothetical protein